MRSAAILLASTIAANACPEGTVARQVEDYSVPMTCNSVLNLKLVCPREGVCSYIIPQSNCSAPVLKTICLTPEELRNAMSDQRRGIE